MAQLRRPDSNRAIGERLRLLRLAYSALQGRARPIGQSEMARLCGIGIQTWHNVEAGHNRIGLDNAMKVRARLGVSLEYIYFDNRLELPNALALEIDKINSPKMATRRA